MQTLKVTNIIKDEAPEEIIVVEKEDTTPNLEFIE